MNQRNGSGYLELDAFLSKKSRQTKKSWEAGGWSVVWLVLKQVYTQSTRAKTEGIHTCGMLPHTVYEGFAAFDAQTREWSCNNHHVFSLKNRFVPRQVSPTAIYSKPKHKTSMRRNYTPYGKLSLILMPKRMNFFVQTLGFLGLHTPRRKSASAPMCWVS